MDSVADSVVDSVLHIMTGLPRQPKVPVWVTDDRWGRWHVWLPTDTMWPSGRALTACGAEWYWSTTAATSYQIMAEAGCDDCRAWLVGQGRKRGRGRRPRLPQGPLPPRTPGKPGRPVADEIIEPLPLPTGPLAAPSIPKTPETGVKTRTERLLELGATPVTYTRPDGTVIKSAKGTKAMRAALDAEEQADAMAEEDFTFEVGRRLPAWNCIWCGQVLVHGDRFCSTWCSTQQREEDYANRWERTGRTMARRQFLDQLYGRPRRDTIRSWTPPARQIRKTASTPYWQR